MPDSRGSAVTPRSLGGGVGVLVDGGGDDLYESGAYGQGNAYWWAAGFFEDRGGNDTYHMMQYGLGTAPHFGIGVCVDLSGDDKYNVDFKIMQRLMGHGRDGSVGIFIDGDGDDAYRFSGATYHAVTGDVNNRFGRNKGCTGAILFALTIAIGLTAALELSS